MARPRRFELAGALYYVTSRGAAGADIFRCAEDRQRWLTTLAQVCARFNWTCHAYCQLTNYYELLIKTPDANLSAGMRQLNGVYTQGFNRVHALGGPVFQGRFKAVLVEQEGFLLAVAREVVLSPLRAKRVRRLEQWPWSSYLATCGQGPQPTWLDSRLILAQFGQQRARALAKYLAFVQEGRDAPSVWSQVQQQIYLGSATFVEKSRAGLAQKPAVTVVPPRQRRALTRALGEYAQAHERDTAIALAYLSGNYTLAVLAAHFGVHYSTVSRLATLHEAAAAR